MTKTIAIVTGKRGGFGAMYKIIQGIESDEEMDLFIIATDMHLSKTFGYTLNEVESAIRVNAVIDLGEYGDQMLDRTQAMSKLISGLAEIFNRKRPDIVLLLGDRGETLAAAVCAIEMGILVAHIQAGDISGGIDEIHRHAITKLAHLHFSQNESQRQRVISLGESPDRVWNVGAPYVDNILNEKLMDYDEALAKYGLKIPYHGYYVVLQHSDTYRPQVGYEHMLAILQAMDNVDTDVVVVYPCSDPGYHQVIEAIDEYLDRSRFHFFRNIEATTFLGILSGAKAIIGNSSGGIIEAPYLNVPFINVGLRQDGREKALNTYSCDGKREEIEKALEIVDTNEFYTKMIGDKYRFGDGNASKRILEILKSIDIKPELFRKRITY